MSDKYANANLREMEISGAGFKDQKDSGLLNPIARETQDTVTGDNPQKEYVTAALPKGPLGSTGRH